MTRTLLPLVLLLPLVACSTPPDLYRTASPWPIADDDRATSDGEPQFERGSDWGFVDDLIAFTLGLPSKILLFNLNVDRHRISPEVEEALRKYLEVNRMDDVKVRLNQYDPIGEWDRLFRNSKVGWPGRYTLGILNNIVYTLMPGILFGGDNYNPFTDTINIYSDLKSVAWHEGAHAKDFAKKYYKAWYAAMRLLPFVDLFQEFDASEDAIRYAYYIRDRDGELECYRLLFPAYGTYVSGYAKVFIPLPSDPILQMLIGYGLIIPGHIVGQVQAAVRDAHYEEYED